MHFFSLVTNLDFQSLDYQLDCSTGHEQSFYKKLRLQPSKYENKFDVTKENIRKWQKCFSFSHRGANLWNSLPAETKQGTLQCSVQTEYTIDWGTFLALSVPTSSPGPFVKWGRRRQKRPWGRGCFCAWFMVGQRWGFVFGIYVVFVVGSGMGTGATPVAGSLETFPIVGNSMHLFFPWI